MAATHQPDQPESKEALEPWTPSQHESALAHLEHLQIQIDRLRSAIPSIVSPLARPRTGKAQMYAQVKKAALQSTQELKDFKEGWGSQQTMEVLGRARASLERDGDLGAAGGVGRYGWAEKEEVEGSEGK